MPTKISNWVIALLRCGKGRPRRSSIPVLALKGADTQLCIAAAADQGAGPPQAVESAEVMRAAPCRPPSARSWRSSPIIAEFKGVQILASACRAARSSPPRGLANAAKPRFDW